MWILLGVSVRRWLLHRVTQRVRRVLSFGEYLLTKIYL